MIAASVLLQPHASAATTLWVNDDAASYRPPGQSCDDAGYSAIQAAVNAALPGDTVNVCPGSYTENVVIATSKLTVTSTAGASATVVKSAAAGTDVFSINYAYQVTIDGFTLVPAGLYAKHDIGVNVYVDANTKATIVHNKVVGGRIGINLGCGSSSSTVADNTVDSAWEAGINIDTCEGSEAGSDGNSVHHNRVCSGMFSYSIAAGEKSDNNAIHDNVALWITVAGTGNTVHNNTATYFNVFAGNTEFLNTTDPNACICGS